MKKIIFILLLYTSCIFSQGYIIRSDELRDSMANIMTWDDMVDSLVATDTTALKLKYSASDLTIYLQAINTTNNTGGGLFALKDSAYAENGIVVFDSPQSGKQWVRQEFLDNPQIVNFGWTGADNSGMTDESEKFRQCMLLRNSTALENPTVVFPVGVYQLAIKETVNKYVRIIGSGKTGIYVNSLGDVQGTILVPPDTASTHVYITTQYAEIKNITFLNTTAFGLAGTCSTALSLVGSFDSNIQGNVFETYLGTALYLQNSYRCYVANNNTYENAYGLYAKGNIASSVFMNNMFGTNSLRSIYIEGLTTLVSFYDCDVEWGGIAGADTLIEVVNCENIIFNNIYNELSDDPDAKFLVIRSEGMQSSVIINGTDIGHTDTDSTILSPITVKSGTRETALTINGGYLRYSGDVPITVEGTTPYPTININDVAINYSNDVNSQNTYTVKNYRADTWNKYNLSNQMYNGTMKFLGQGGFTNGIRSSGVGNNLAGHTQYSRSVLNLPLFYSSVTTLDTVELYIPFVEKPSATASATFLHGEALIKYGILVDGTGTSQIFKIGFTQSYNGADATLYEYTIDTLLTTLNNNNKLLGVGVVTKNDSALIIAFYTPANASSSYWFSGMISGNNVGDAVLRDKSSETYLDPDIELDNVASFYDETFGGTSTFSGSIVATENNHAFGVDAAVGWVGNRFRNVVNSPGSVLHITLGSDFDPILTAAENDTNYLAKVGVYGGSITTYPNDTVQVVASIHTGDPVINVGAGGAVREAAVIYIRSVPTEGMRNSAINIQEGDIFMQSGGVEARLGNSYFGNLYPQNIIVIDTIDSQIDYGLRMFNTVPTPTSALGYGVGIQMGYAPNVYYNTINTVFEGNSPSYLNPALTFSTMYNTSAGGTETEKMRITSAGKVGIGTPTPDSLLTVNGSAHIIGNLKFDGTRLNATNIPSDSTGLPTGIIYFDSTTGALKRKF